MQMQEIQDICVKYKKYEADNGENEMAELENSKDLISVLWSGADILRSKMDANEYKDYLLGIVFYKYLSDSFLIKVYDLIYDEKPESLKVALEAYKEALEDESAEELKEQIKSALDEIDLSAITGSVEEDAEVPTAEEGTDVITIDDSSIPEDIQGYLSVKLNDSIGVGHLELSRENEEYPYINMDITFDTTVLEDALIEAPESATDVIDIIPNIAQFVTSLMQLGQEMETEDDFGELESIDWSGLESELESVDWSELESISIDDLAE